MENKIIEVDLSSGNISAMACPAAYEQLGGRGLTSTIISGEVEPSRHPLSAENMVVIAPGLLAGTVLSSSNRLSAGAKSPLTGGIKEANCGGVVAYKLGRLGIKALKIKGKADADAGAICIIVDSDGVRLETLPFLKGGRVYETAERLVQKFGNRAGFIITGPAGEMRMPAACLSVNDPEGEPCRNLGRGGIGAVMGSKGIKAVIVDDRGVDLSDSGMEEKKAVIKKFASLLRAHPVTGDRFPQYGTAMTLNAVNSLGGLPTRNFSQGRFESADRIGGESLYETITSRGGKHAHACMPGCVIRCSNKYVARDGSAVVGSLDYETLCLLGSNIGLADLDQVAQLNRLCNEFGVDTIEIGNAIGVLAEAGVVGFGDYDSIRKIVEELGSGTPLGRLLGSGAAVCGKVYGVERVPVVKGQGMAAYDPRAIKGLGVTYAMSPMGANHTAGNAITLEVDHLDPAVQLEPMRDLNLKTMVIDTLGLCLFTGRVSLGQPEIIEEISAVYTGQKATFDEMMKTAEACLLREKAFNRQAGLTRFHDRIPDFMQTEKLPPHDTVFDIADQDLDRFYDFKIDDAV